MADVISREEQQAIARFKGKVQKIDRGATSQGYRWDPEINRLVSIAPTRWNNNIFHNPATKAAEMRRKRIVGLASQGKTQAEIKRITGHSGDTIRRHLSAAGVKAAPIQRSPKTGKKPATKRKARQAEVRAILRENIDLPRKEIAAKARISTSALSQYLVDRRTYHAEGQTFDSIQALSDHFGVAERTVFKRLREDGRADWWVETSREVTI